ncbi:hypothetical protein CEXT_354411 [Caerostris extrusa]|uniref:Uncharacterized protein n=1 Tax=Caerostris extrusa TaxID=172846 RepID=A0AAV4Y1D2_CAEEX|nr:hypothetical protein CEXT_354411 [Caerostris extrusa]
MSDTASCSGEQVDEGYRDARFGPSFYDVKLATCVEHHYDSLAQKGESNHSNSYQLRFEDRSGPHLGETRCLLSDICTVIVKSGILNYLQVYPFVVGIRNSYSIVWTQQALGLSGIYNGTSVQNTKSYRFHFMQGQPHEADVISALFS